MKGIVLAGGSGTRLYPLTLGCSKQLLAIYDKPMIYYPISVLMLAGIKEILIICTSEYLSSYRRLLGNGEALGIKIEYAVQAKPEGIAQAFIIGESFIGKERVCLILGDNIFYGQGFTPKLIQAKSRKLGATIFGYRVSDPRQFGVVSLDEENKVSLIEEKPTNPKSKFAITGLYFYDNEVVSIAKKIQPSKRGELEITSINKIYLKNKNLHCEMLGRGFAWLDTGTHKNLLEASNLIQTIERRQNLKIACLEEIAFNNGWLSLSKLTKRASELEKSEYGQYLYQIIDENYAAF